MPKSALSKTKRPRKTVDLAGRYREIGISAVAAALRCQNVKKPDDRSLQQKTNSRHAEKRFSIIRRKTSVLPFAPTLLSQKLQASYKEDQARPLSPRTEGLLKTLEHRKSSKTH
jgi:hypothetical protein